MFTISLVSMLPSRLGYLPVALLLGLSSCVPMLVYANPAAEPRSQSTVNSVNDTAPANTMSTNKSLQNAEFNYRARRLSAAMEQFGMVAAMQDHPFAWLRVGNICHRRGDASGALDAYQRAAKAAARSPEFAALGHRAVMNQALLGLDQAQSALETLGMTSPGAGDEEWADEMQLRLQELSAAMPAIKPQHAH